MSGILDTDRAVAVVTYALSSLAIYWGCKRSVANDSRTASSQELPMRHDYMQGAPASLRSWGARCSFVAGVIIAMGLIGVFSHLVVYLTSREFPNWLFAIATVAQITHSMHELFGETISVNLRRLPLSIPLSKLRAVSLPLACGLSVAFVTGVYNGHRWIQGILIATTVFSKIGGTLFAGYLLLSNNYFNERQPTQNSGLHDTEFDSPEVKLMMAMNFANMYLTLPGRLLATTLQYEHAKADEYENKLETIPWRFKADTTLYNAASRIFYFGLIFLAAAEILGSGNALRVVRGMSVICAPSIPVVTRLMVLARRGGFYEEYMVYPNRE